jgi:hypothetical protein
MIKETLLAAIVACSQVVSAQASNPAGMGVKVDVAPESVEVAISWLPADTETIVVSRGPFGLTTNAPVRETKDNPISDKELMSDFEDLSLGQFLFKDGLLAKRLEKKTVNFAVEGSRHFRPPADLGEMRYEGCSIILFTDDLGDEIGSFAKDARRSALNVEGIANHQVFVFQEKLERDTWTTFAAFPNDHMVLLATDRNYLVEVLARMGGKIGPRALPDDLPEWKYVNTHARSWGLRHYDNSQSQLDPTSPQGGRKSANFPDEQAIGLAFVFDPQSGRLARVTYLSRNLGIGSKPTETPLGMANSPEAKGLDIKYRELSPGVVEASYSLEHRQALQFFLFVLEGILGHAIYI